jgi:hypothetical protein
MPDTVMKTTRGHAKINRRLLGARVDSATGWYRNQAIIISVINIISFVNNDFLYTGGTYSLQSTPSPDVQGSRSWII